MEGDRNGHAALAPDTLQRLAAGRELALEAGPGVGNLQRNAGFRVRDVGGFDVVDSLVQAV